MSFSPSDLQTRAMRTMKDWFKSSISNQVFYLAGFAGTGKSTIVEHVIDDMGLDISNQNDVMVGAYMGKAAHVLRRKGMSTASTIHSMIYTPVEDEDGRIHFELNRDSEVRNTRLLVLDECSMINEQMKADIESFGTKILNMGDPGQLDPVSGQGAFQNRKPDFFLDEIHRQAADNPIIRLSMMAREGKRIQQGEYDGLVKVLRIDDFDFEELIAADQVICGKNATRRTLNQEMKGYHGFHDDLPIDTEGAKLICLRNNHDLGLLNGMGFTSTKIKNGSYKSQNGKFFTMSVKDEDGFVLPNLEVTTMPFMEDAGQSFTEKQRLDMEKSRLSQFTWNYCCTCHKAQGSQWDNVAVWDDHYGLWGDHSQRKKWMYTAITRSAEKLTLLQQ